MSILLNSNSVYHGTYDTQYATTPTFRVSKNNNVVIFVLIENFKNIPSDWIQIGELNDEAIRPVSDYIYSIPCNNSATFQIMVDNDMSIKARYTGGTNSIAIVQDTLVWFSD